MKKILWILTGVLLLSLNTQSQTRDSIHGEIVADTNNIKILKVWGNAEERAYAYGYLLNEQIIDVWENWILLWIGADYQVAREMITDGDILIVDSSFRSEASFAIKGMADAGVDTSNFDTVDFLVLNFSNDLGSFFSKKGFNCSTFMNWGDATVGTDLEGKSVISRHFDNSQWLPAGVNNSVITVHIPSEAEKQPWLNADAAGFILPWGAGVNHGGISIFLNSMSDLSTNPVPGTIYQSNYYLAREILESEDYNGDGVNNTQDVRDAFNENPQGFPGDYIISSMAKWDSNSDSLTAMVAEVAPVSPHLVFRTNSFADLIPGVNLYAANSQIKRNNSQNYCTRYYNILNNMGNGLNIGSQENWDLMANYSHSISGYNYMFCQHIPEPGIFKISTYRNSTQAYLLEPLEINLNEIFNMPPEFDTQPDTVMSVNEEYIYEIEVSDINKYDSIIITAEELPSWLSLIDNGNGTATLSGLTNQVGIYNVIVKASDGMTSTTQEFSINAVSVNIRNVEACSINVYPNPVLNILRIDINKNASAKVFTHEGIQIMDTNLHKGLNYINLSNLADGMYIVVLYINKKNHVFKVIKL
jgi:hypothetical protein